MKALIESLERLSEAAYEALPLLEKNDYRKEADNYYDNKLELRVIPRLLQDILNSMLKYAPPSNTTESASLMQPFSTPTT